MLCAGWQTFLLHKLDFGELLRCEQPTVEFRIFLRPFDPFFFAGLARYEEDTVVVILEIHPFRLLYDRLALWLRKRRIVLLSGFTRW
jgi:hypothetical protein